MHEAFFPLTFHRYNRPLRGLMIERQPWFAVRDFGLLIGHRHPERIWRLMDEDQRRTARFSHASGDAEEVQLISESGIYRALCRFTHPENRSLRRWLTHEVLPALRDHYAHNQDGPKRTLMQWGAQQVCLLEWQGNWWVPLDNFPAAARLARKSRPGFRLRFWR